MYVYEYIYMGLKKYMLYISRMGLRGFHVHVFPYGFNLCFRGP